VSPRLARGSTLAGLLALSLLVGGCPDDPASQCPDTDGDGYGACDECNDSDPSIHPGAAEACDQVDNDCDEVVDEGCTEGEVTYCHPADGDVACGVEGAGCLQPCGEDNILGACQRPEGPVDTDTDPNNCGECGQVCPTPTNAPVACLSGQCGRGSCEAGWFDLDGSGGCRWQCEGKVCTDLDGNTQTPTNAPLPERGQVFQAFSSGSSWGGAVQTSEGYTNMGVVGEPTPPALGGVIEQTSEGYRHQGGVNAAAPH